MIATDWIALGRGAAAAILLFLAGTTQALTLSLSPSITVASADETVTLDVLFDDDGGSPVVGGGLDVVYDPGALQLIDYQYHDFGSPFFRPTPIKTPGRLISLGVGDIAGLPSQGTIATVTFRVLQTGTTRIELTDTIGIAGPWTPLFGGTFDSVYVSALISPPDGTYPILRLPDDFATEDVPTDGFVHSVVTAFNDGSAALDVFSIAFEGSGPGEYSVASDGCSGVSIAAGASCDVVISYSAKQIRPPFLTARLNVVFNTSDPIQVDNEVTLTTRVLSAIIYGTNLEFAEVSPKGPFARQRATVTNVGTWPGDIASLRFLGGGGSDFHVTENDCSGRRLAVGAECELEFEYRPSSAGGDFVQYQLSYNSGAARSGNALTGFTPTGIPVVTYEGPQEFLLPVGTAVTRRITVTNSGSEPLTLLSQPLNSLPTFTVADFDCGLFAIAPGASCFIDVQAQTDVPGYVTWIYETFTDSVAIEGPLFIYLLAATPAQ